MSLMMMTTRHLYPMEGNRRIMTGTLDKAIPRARVALPASGHRVRRVRREADIWSAVQVRMPTV